jgi:hypothetical protein
MKSKNKSQILLAVLLFLGCSLSAQTKLTGSYVATKVSYLSGEDLPDENIIKYTYVKYTFTPDGQIGISGSYDEKNTEYLFEVKGNRLFIKSNVGSLTNTLKIMEASEDKLVLISGSVTGALDDPKAIKYTLYNEKLIQKRMPLTSGDIFSIKDNDTTYKSGQKIYAQFQGPSFQRYIYAEVAKKKLEPKDVELVSTFIINEKGKPDSVKILQGISTKFDAEYIKAFNSAKNMWTPASHNGKNVKVMMSVNLKYLSSATALPSYFSAKKANDAFNQKDYELALYHYDKALGVKPDEAENLYRRGICKQMLGNLKGACEDWLRIQQMGKSTADELLLKYCK